jgi:hypothetical protein
MPHYIVKLDTKDGPRYLEWSTVVDAPVTYGMTLDDFTQYWRKEYGAAADRGDRLEARLRDVESKGTDSYSDASVDATIANNRAGAGETCLTKEQLVEYYCHRRGRHPKGT